MEEDYKKEIEKLKEEIKELKKDRKKESFLTETLRWLNIGDAKSKVYLYLLKKKRATAKEIIEGRSWALSHHRKGGTYRDGEGGDT